MKTLEIKNVVDERIVRLNEIASIKLLRGIFKNRREQLKEDRCLAKYVIENYDSEDALTAILKDKEVRESEVTDIVAKRVKELKKKRLAAKTSKKAKTDNSTSEEKEAVSKAGRPTSRKVGDRHPKHPEWLWTEYKPGKFDWRVDKNYMYKNSSPKRTKSVITVEQFLHYPKPKSLSTAQKNILKNINKGYKILKNSNGAWFVQEDGGTIENCDMDAFYALLKKMSVMNAEIKDLFVK